MLLTTWLLYISVISVLIFTPGPSALLCVSDGLKFGNRKTVATVLGGAVAALVLMSISAAGLGAVLIASEKLFFIIKLIGAFYLVYLGWMSWKAEHCEIIETNDAANKNDSYDALFRKGFMVGISNPKDLLFFIALFPSFMNVNASPSEQYIVLASTWFVIDCSSMLLYSRLGSKASPWLNNANNVKRFNRLVGGLFVTLGSVLAISTAINNRA